MKFIADKDNLRLDIFLAEKSAISRSNAKNIIENQGVFINGKLKHKSGLTIKINDCIEFEIPKPKKMDLTPNNIPLDIVYQDQNFAIINKKQGMVVHPATSYHKNDTLVNALLYHIDNLSGINGIIRPGIVHRLDKDTSGLLAIAKNDMAHHNLAKQIETKSARRIYFGLCDGNFKEDCGKVDQPIARSKKDRKKMAIDENGRNAVTNYRVIERFGKYTLVRFELETGRTHQIRVHAKFLHHPIVGDEVYGGSNVLYKNGQLLHAKELHIKNPENKENMIFECDLPDYFEKVLEKLRKKSLY